MNTNAAWVTWLKIFGVKLHFKYFRSCELSELWDDTLETTNQYFQTVQCKYFQLKFEVIFLAYYFN